MRRKIRKGNFGNVYSSEDSGQPADSHSLIRIFTVCILVRQGCKVLHAENKDSDQTARICIVIL